MVYIVKFVLEKILSKVADFINWLIDFLFIYADIFTWIKSPIK